MKIGGPLDSQPIKGTDKSEGDIKSSKKGKLESRKDELSISSEAKKLAEITSTPLLRQEKIDLAKERIKSGFYDTKLEDIATSILKEIFG